MKKMLTGVSAALYAALCGGAFATGLPEAEFRDPSVANRPETWFHFIGGNLAMVGIFLIPIAVMTCMNLIRVYRESKLIEKIRKEDEAA